MNIGIFNATSYNRRGGEKVATALAVELSRAHRVTLLIGKAPVRWDEAKIEEYFGEDLSRVRVLPLKNVRDFRGPPPTPIMRLALFRELRGMKFDVFVNCVWYDSMPNPGRYGIYFCMFPHPLITPELIGADQPWVRATAEKARAVLRRRGIRSYQLLLVTSNFTRDRIKRVWGRNSKVLYPICNQIGVEGDPKEKKILMVRSITSHRRLERPNAWSKEPAGFRFSSTSIFHSINSSLSTVRAPSIGTLPVTAFIPRTFRFNRSTSEPQRSKQCPRVRCRWSSIVEGKGKRSITASMAFDGRPLTNSSISHRNWQPTSP